MCIRDSHRSTPCPNVKHSDEWGDPAACENGDSCGYCHTRTEQQFHPEVCVSTTISYYFHILSITSTYFLLTYLWLFVMLFEVDFFGKIMLFPLEMANNHWSETIRFFVMSMS